MKISRWLLAGVAGLALAGGLVTVGSTTAAPALAQFNPEPQDCACSRGTDVGTAGAPVILKHCMCGQLQCAVLPAAGQLQCSR
jgi:hypothetical protein